MTPNYTWPISLQDFYFRFIDLLILIARFHCQFFALFIKKHKFCMYETYIRKTTGDHIRCFETVNNHVIVAVQILHPYVLL